MADDTDWDMIVVGGGIHGVGVAQAAAAAGYRVALLEQTGLAAGTSSRSSKLIHGGLRYLETGQFRLVRESLRERALLLRLAPHLVRMQPFRLPVYPETTRRPWQLHIGLTLYGMFAGKNEHARYSTLPREKWWECDGLSTDSLQCIFQYWDAQTDDRELTRAVMRSAEQLGARQLCPAQMLHAELHAHGCTVTYQQSGTEQVASARVLVNAAGPWANQVLQHVHPIQSPAAVELVQGTHIELPGELTGGCYYVEAPDDRRAVFILPWHHRTLVGTTETLFTGDPGDVAPHAHEIEYLLRVYQYYFPDRRREVLDAWAGLRVLPASSRNPFSRSRETQFLVDRPQAPRLLTVLGGKLTSYRATAEKVVQRLQTSLPTRQRRARTEHLQLEP